MGAERAREQTHDGTGGTSTSLAFSGEIISLVHSQLVGSMNSVHALAERGPSKFLMTIGAALMLAVVAMKLSVGGERIVTDLSVGEFVAGLALGTALVLSGAILSTYQWARLSRQDERLIDLSADGTQRAFDLTSRLLEEQES